jgi:hypothetical protein
MVEMSALWLPMLVSAVLVFVASSVVHMVLPYHRSDYDRLPNEDAILDGLRAQNAGPGDYVFPYAVGADCKDPQVKAKMERGPIGFMTVRQGFSMGTSMGVWFVNCLLMSLFGAYLASRFVAPGSDYLEVFRLVGTVTFLGYAGAAPANSIWMGRKWSATFKHMFDGLLYGLLTAGVFGWLWPA